MTDQTITITPNPFTMGGEYLIINPVANDILRGTNRLVVTETGCVPDNRNRAQRRKDASRRK